MTNKEIVARLAELGVKASAKERKSVLEEKLAKATMNTQETKKVNPSDYSSVLVHLQHATKKL